MLIGHQKLKTQSFNYWQEQTYWDGQSGPVFVKNSGKVRGIIYENIPLANPAGEIILQYMKVSNQCSCAPHIYTTLCVDSIPVKNWKRTENLPNTGWEVILDWGKGLSKSSIE